MALPNKEKYEQRKIDSLIQYLRLYSQKGQPVDYEILVDGFKAVRRTNDPDMFTMFENFVTADTRSIEVLLFTGSSNNNEKRIFYFGEPPDEREKEGGLTGVEVEKSIREQVIKDMKFDALKDENAVLRKQVDDLEKEVDELEKKNAVLETKQSPLNGFLGDLGASLVEGFIKRNPKLISALPGGEALAGLLQSNDQNELHSDTVESEVSFKSKGETSSLREEDQLAIQFASQLKSQFTKDEFENVLNIIQTLADDKSKIDLIMNHVNIASAKASARIKQDTSL